MTEQGHFQCKKEGSCDCPEVFHRKGYLVVTATKEYIVKFGEEWQEWGSEICRRASVARSIWLFLGIIAMGSHKMMRAEDRGTILAATPQWQLGMYDLWTQSCLIWAGITNHQWHQCLCIQKANRSTFIKIPDFHRAQERFGHMRASIFYNWTHK